MKNTKLKVFNAIHPQTVWVNPEDIKRCGWLHRRLNRQRQKIGLVQKLDLVHVQNVVAIKTQPDKI